MGAQRTKCLDTAQWHLTGSPHAGSKNQFKLGVQKSGEVCALGRGGGFYLLPREWVGCFQCVSETLVNISLNLPPRKQHKVVQLYKRL